MILSISSMRYLLNPWIGLERAFLSSLFDSAIVFKSLVSGLARVSSFFDEGILHLPHQLLAIANNIMQWMGTMHHIAKCQDICRDVLMLTFYALVHTIYRIAEARVFLWPLRKP